MLLQPKGSKLQRSGMGRGAYQSCSTLPMKTIVLARDFVWACSSNGHVSGQQVPHRNWFPFPITFPVMTCLCVSSWVRRCAQIPSLKSKVPWSSSQASYLILSGWRVWVQSEASHGTCRPAQIGCTKILQRSCGMQLSLTFFQERLLTTGTTRYACSWGKLFLLQALFRHKSLKLESK